MRALRSVPVPQIYLLKRLCVPACLYVSVRLCVRRNLKKKAVRGCHRCGFLSPPCLRQGLWYVFGVCTRLAVSLPTLPLPSRPECTVTSGFICVLGIQTLPQQAVYLWNACFVSDLECFPGSNLGQWSTEAVKCRLNRETGLGSWAENRWSPCFQKGLRTIGV